MTETVQAYTGWIFAALIFLPVLPAYAGKVTAQVPATTRTPGGRYRKEART